jgi:hypothetical protein
MDMFTKKDILDALGANTEDHFLSGLLLGIGVGALVGSAAAILLAPKTGQEMRQLLSERGQTFVEKARNRIGMAKSDGGQRPGSEPGGL